jgi:DNA-directed RNA polymerase subunit beta'
MKHPLPPPVMRRTKASRITQGFAPPARLVDDVSIKLAAPHVIKRWATTLFYNGQSIGAITSAETLHYRTLKPVFGGFFCERIFGPVKDWECQCGRVRALRPPKVDMWCPKCIVQITRSATRRHRFGYIALGTPIFHLWYQRGDTSTNPLKRIFHFEPHILRDIMDAQLLLCAEKHILTACTVSGTYFTLRNWDHLLHLLHTNLYVNTSDQFAPWTTESRCKTTPVHFQRFRYLHNISTYGFWTLLKRRQMSEVAKHMTYYLRFLRTNRGLLSSNTLLWALIRFSVVSGEVHDELMKDLQKKAKNTIARRQQIISSLIFARQCFFTQMRPEWVFLQNLPVLPPTLRPILQLGNGTLAVSDLNELYRLVFFRTTRLRKLILLNVPEILISTEIRLVQDAVNAVLDNGRLKYPIKRTVMFEVKEPLRSLADRIVGKEGRFRQNLLGKRVDYSGRSVIIVGPTLRLWECGLPREMAIILFQPILIHRLLTSGMVTSLRHAKRFIEMYPMTTMEMLHHLVSLHPILLNRAPTLHRMGIQAFLPRIIPGRAIQLHPFVCPAFNADFDGDQMAVHIPLLPEAIVEARLLLFAPLNWISPASGEPSLIPSQDIILGIYYLTLSTSTNASNDMRDARLHDLVWIETDETTSLGDAPSPLCTYVTRTGYSYTLYSSSLCRSDPFGKCRSTALVTTLGRHLFHTYLPHTQSEDSLPCYGTLF